MLAVARGKIPAAQLVRAAVPPLPFGDATFDRLVTSHFYGHLVAAEGMAFLAEARRVAPELVVVDSAAYLGVRPDGWRERVLRDGSRYTIYKRHFTAEQLLAELGGDGAVLFAGGSLWPFVPLAARPSAVLGRRMRPRPPWQGRLGAERVSIPPDEPGCLLRNIHLE